MTTPIYGSAEPMYSKGRDIGWLNNPQDVVADNRGLHVRVGITAGVVRCRCDRVRAGNRLPGRKHKSTAGAVVPQ